MSRLSRIVATTATVVATAALAAVPLTGVADAAPAPAAGHPVPYVGPPCAVGTLCVWDGPNFTGTRHDFYYCGNPFPVNGVTPPLSRVGSLVNNETEGTVATFYSTGPNGTPQAQFSSTAFDVRYDTTAGAPITYVKPC